MESDAVIRVMLVDDHAVVRAGYKRFIETDEKIRIVAEASTGEEAYTQLARIDVDVIILDLSMPGQGGFETLRRIINRHPKKKVLIFSMHENPSIARQALQIGASGYLTKSMDPEKIIVAIHEVWRGGTPIEEGIAKGIKRMLRLYRPTASHKANTWPCFGARCNAWACTSTLPTVPSSGAMKQKATLPCIA